MAKRSGLSRGLNVHCNASAHVLLDPAWLSAQFDLLRPVYRGDFCRGNSMQFLSHFSCNSKIARVKEVRF